MRRKGVLFVLLAAAAALSWMAVQRAEQSLSAVVTAEKAGRQQAFFKALWGMTPSQVGRVNGAVLKPSSSSERFYRPEDFDRSQYISYQQEGIRYLGREAAVTYTFRDRHLFATHVFVSDPNGDALDADVRRHLTRVFGADASAQDDQSSLKLIWQFKDRIVNYWFMEDDLSLRSKYTAVIGVTAQ